MTNCTPNSFKLGLCLLLIHASIVICLPIHQVQAQTLRVARSAGPPGLGNPFTSVAQPGSGVWSMIFDSLTMFDESRTLEPSLALSWRPTSETTWEFHLRSDAVFHNGKRADATLIAQSIGLLLTDEARLYYVYPNLDTLHSVRVVNADTIEITTNRADPILPQRLSILMIVEPGAWEELGPAAFAKAPVGTGPYRLKEWGRGNAKIVLEAFDQSWRPPKDVTRIEMTIMPDAVSRTQALLSGVVDIVEEASRSFAVEGRSDLMSIVYPVHKVSMLTFRLVGNEDSPLIDPRVREALSYVVNRAAIADIIYEGDVQPANQPITSEIVGYNADLPPVPQDIERAKSLLAEAGFADGFELNAEFVNGSTEEAQQMLQLIAQDMRRVGIRLKLNPTTIQSFFYKWQSGDWEDTDLFLGISDGSVFFDAERPLWLLSCDKPSPFSCNEVTTKKLRDVDDIMDVETRTEKLKSLVAEVSLGHPAVWLTTMSNRILTNDRIENLPIRPQGIAFEKVELQ